MRMSSQIFSPIIFITILTCFCVKIPSLNAQCIDDQRSLLLQLNNTLTFSSSSSSSKMVKWNQNTDCCLWEGITCSKAGYVIGLDLSSQSISGGINSSSSVFSLKFLESLNLADNSFDSAEIPAAFINLTSLTYLNLSNAGFGGQIPIEISRLTNLVTLDLSTFFDEDTHLLKLENPNLTMIVQNLTSLVELNLDSVNISAEGHDWCGAVSSSLPKLRVLSLSNCQLSGPIHSSLLDLQFLSVVRLDANSLNAPVPKFLANFKNLTVLHLNSCNLTGEFPQQIFNVPSLQSVDLSINELLNGSLPEFLANGLLQNLLIRSTGFSGALPNSMENLTQLIHVDLSSNMFSGRIPSFQMSKNLTHIRLYRNNFSGSIPSNHFKGLLKLQLVDLHFNSFSGRIPASLFGLPSLKTIALHNNQFSGRITEILNPSASMLDMLDLSGNKLEGEIPYSFFELKRLEILSLSSNNLNGTVKIEFVQKLVNLQALDLSYNKLLIETNGNRSNWYGISQRLSALSLASCKLRDFPDLRNQSKLYSLDLSNNQIGGEIPNWIWTFSRQMWDLNLSHNLFENFQEPYSIPSLTFLDIHSNYLRGELPIPPEFAFYVDYSSNYFSSAIPYDLGNNLKYCYSFSVANNKLRGEIPGSICNATFLQVLDLSNNSLVGAIPLCLIESIQTLGVLNLGKNRLTGNISGTFQQNCGLHTLDLHENLLEGKIPESLANCTSLEVLNLGYNRMLDTFPSFLINSTNLRVLVLRSNLLHGCIQCSGVNKNWSNLQIIDIASNDFSGALVPDCFSNLKAMLDVAGSSRSKASHLRFEFLNVTNLNYLDTVTVTNKGQQMELVKILTIFTSIDFSNNRFKGEIPETIGELKSIYVLNLSHNGFTGSIPVSFGNLRELESLDLSSNNIHGKIPTELAGLSFLSFLNLSYNQLSGVIPSGTQLQSFAETSFEGNNELCGPPLKKSCNPTETVTTKPDNKHLNPKCGMKWEFLGGAGFGYAVGLGFVIGPLFFCKRWSLWYWKYVELVVSLIVNEKYKQGRAGYKKPIRRI